jgi:tungstate transport system substrate-binding protein
MESIIITLGRQRIYIADRGTWLSFNNKGSLIVAIEGDPRLLNRYDVIELNPQKHAGAKLTTAP